MPGSATDREARVRAAFAEQAMWCDRLGSPFTGRLCAVLGERLARDSEIGRRVLGWSGPPEAVADNVPLRLCGGLHALVRGDIAPDLAACYPPQPLPDEALLWAALEPALHLREGFLLPWLDSAPQTNEVGRSAVLMAGLLVIADVFDQPMELMELGASGGLNLLLDRYAYDLDGLQAGRDGAALHLAPEWKGPSPPGSRVTIAARSGVDLSPMDVRKDRDRLLAYVWPDQPKRIAQLESALAVALTDPPTLDRGDAADWIEGKLVVAPTSGRTQVVLHSVAFQYFPAETQARVAAAIGAAGAEAGPDHPFAWLRFEKLPEDEAYSLRLRLWPDGEDRLLAWAHPHGSSVRWVA